MIKQKVKKFVRNVFETLGGIGKDAKDNLVGAGDYQISNNKLQEKVLPKEQKNQIQGSEAARLAQVRKNLMEINNQLKQSKQEQAMQAKKQKDKDWAIKQQIKSAQGSKEAAQRASG